MATTLFYFFFPSLLLFLAIAERFNFRFIQTLRDKLAHGNPLLVDNKGCQFVSKILLLVLAWFHVAWVSFSPEHIIGLIPTTAIMIFLVSRQRTINLMDAINSIKSVNVFLMTITLVMGMMSFWNVDFLPFAITLGYILIFSYIMPDDNVDKLLEEYENRVMELTSNRTVELITNRVVEVLDERKNEETETVKDEVSEKPKRKKHYHCNRFPKKNKNKENSKIKHNYTKRNKYSQVK